MVARRLCIEPTAALDPQARRNRWDLLASLDDDGRTVVLTTHYMDEAEALCDRVAIMDHGRILELDSPAALVRGLDGLQVQGATLEDVFLTLTGREYRA